MLLTEQLVGEARERRARKMATRQTVVAAASGACFLAAALLIAALLPTERATDPALIAALIVGYAAISRVRFEFGHGYVTLEEFAFVPMLMLVPLPLIPLGVAVAAILAMVPDVVRGTWARDRWISCLSDSWFAIGPVLVLAALAPGTPALADAPVYALALAAQFGGDLVWAVIRDKLERQMSPADMALSFLAAVRFDAMIFPIAFCVGLVAVDQQAMLAALVPLVMLLQIFSDERRARFDKTLELHRAYRGVVMLLSDLIEQDDTYTAHHSRSLVDLVHGVADELGIEDPLTRQELEFATLLHDVGKISMPDEILNKPGPLTSAEFEVMRTHTVEGQFLLDRVGGMLGEVGEIVRSSHERWDGTGYPDGLVGEQIPLGARIVGACDAFHAIVSNRVYRPARSVEEAVAELRANAGTQFDPRIVSAVTKVIEDREPAIAVGLTSEVEPERAGAAVPQMRPGVAA